MFDDYTNRLAALHSSKMESYLKELLFVFIICTRDDTSVLTRYEQFIMSKTCKPLFEIQSNKEETSWIDCGVQCKTDFRCRGVLLKSGSCHLYGLRRTSAEPQQGLNEENIFLLNDGSVDECRDSSECEYRHRRCVEGKCTCDIGFSYDFWM